MRKTLRFAIGVLVLAVVFLMSSLFVRDVTDVASPKEELSVSEENPVEANPVSSEPTDPHEEHIDTEATTETPDPNQSVNEAYYTPVDQIPEMQITEQFEIVLTETQGTDGV